MYAHPLNVSKLFSKIACQCRHALARNSTDGEITRSATPPNQRLDPVTKHVHSQHGWGCIFHPVMFSPPQSETLTNSSGSSLTVSQVNVIGPGFSKAGLGLPLTLAPGQSTTVSVGFTPQVGGSSSGSLSVISNGLNPTVAVSLSGTGFTPGVLSANPAKPTIMWRRRLTPAAGRAPIRTRRQPSFQVPRATRATAFS
jgi:hypothetical protein